MAVPLPAAPAAALAPIAAPATAIAGMDARAGSTATYDTGSVSGDALEYPIVYSFAWFAAALAAGWTTRNRGGRRYTGSLHGLEDGARRRKE